MDKSKHYYELGVKLLKGCKYKEAIENFDKSINLNQNYNLSYFMRGMAKYELHDSVGSIEDLNQAIVLDLNNSIQYFNRGAIKFQLEDYFGAIEDFSKVIDIEPNYTLAYFNQGAAKFQLEDYFGAIEDFNKVIDIEPNYTLAYFNRGVAKDALENYAGAIEDYSKTIELDSDNLLAYINRGIDNERLNDYLEAIEDFNQANKLDPQNPKVFHHRGIDKYFLEKFPEAIDDLIRAIDLVPEDSEAHNFLGNAKVGLKDYLGALYYYDKAIELDSQVSIYFNNRAIVKTILGDYLGAEDDYNKAIELDPQDPLPYYNLGNNKLDLMDYGGAIYFLNIAIKISPNYTIAYINRGLAKVKIKDYKGAINDYNTAIECDPNNLLAYHNRGIAKGHLMDYNGAIADLYRVIDYTPQDPEVWVSLGNLYRSMKEYDKAIYCLENAQRIDYNLVKLWYIKGLLFLDYEEYYSASSCFNRVIYLDQEKKYKYDIYWILDYAENYSMMPFFIIELLNYVAFPNTYISYINLFRTASQNCQLLYKYEKYLIIEEKSVNENRLFQYYQAFVNYFMGLPSKAFTIYDELDCDDTGLNLYGQYYFIMSAKNFCEPYEGIIEFALEQAEKYYNKEINQLPSELYYAGQIFLAADDILKAEQCFIKSLGFLPSNYMLFYLKSNETLPEENEEAIKTIIAFEIDSKNSDKYLNGFKKRCINIDEPDFFQMFSIYALHREISQAVADVRAFIDENFPESNILKDYELPSLWEAFNISEGDLEIIEKDALVFDIEITKKEIFNLFALKADKLIRRASNYNIDSIIAEKQMKNNRLKILINDLESITEKQKILFKLTSEIEVWSLELDVYLKIIKLLMVQDKLDTESATVLFFYCFIKNQIHIRQIEIKKLIDPITILTEIVFESTMAKFDIHWVIVVTASTLGQHFVRYLISHEWRNEEAPTYIDFKDNFKNYLYNQKENLGDKFDQEFDIENFFNKV